MLRGIAGADNNGLALRALSRSVSRVHLPERFQASFGSYPDGDQMYLEWRDGQLWYECWRPDLKTPYVPNSQPLFVDAKAWIRFWRHVDKIGVWRWREDYSKPILDGWGWSLEMERGGQAIKTGGQNDAPGSDPNDYGYPPTSDFAHFLKALRNLTGKQIW